MLYDFYTSETANKPYATYILTGFRKAAIATDEEDEVMQSSPFDDPPATNEDGPQLVRCVELVSEERLEGII
jgi:hypothetical protein